MPQIAGYARHIARGIEFTHAGIIAFLAVGLFANMLTNSAEISSKPSMIVMADFLVAKKQYLVFGKGGLKLGDFLISQRPGQVDITDRRSDRRVIRLQFENCLLYTSPSPRDGLLSRMPSSA